MKYSLNRCTVDREDLREEDFVETHASRTLDRYLVCACVHVCGDCKYVSDWLMVLILSVTNWCGLPQSNICEMHTRLKGT